MCESQVSKSMIILHRKHSENALEKEHGVPATALISVMQQELVLQNLC